MDLDTILYIVIGVIALASRFFQKPENQRKASKPIENSSPQPSQYEDFDYDDPDEFQPVDIPQKKQTEFINERQPYSIEYDGKPIDTYQPEYKQANSRPYSIEYNEKPLDSPISEVETQNTNLHILKSLSDHKHTESHIYDLDEDLIRKSEIKYSEETIKEPVIEFDAIKAVIYSEILTRKY